jgi:serine/threonine protein kinase
MIFKCSRALDFAYRQGVIHRDLKPANILRSGASGSDVKISDFGAAITTSSDQTPLPASARRPTCRRSRCRTGRSTTAPTSFPSAW